MASGDINNFTTVEQFLAGIKEHPCLYDTKRLDYRDMTCKQNAWEEVRIKSGLATVSECQKLWKRIRDRYVRERKAIEMSLKNGSTNVRKNWELHQQMDFYKDCGRSKQMSYSQSPPSQKDISDDSFQIMETNSLYLDDIDIIKSEDTFDSSSQEPLCDRLMDITSTSQKSPFYDTTEEFNNNSKKRKTSDNELENLNFMNKLMSGNEAFGYSIVKSIDRWKPSKAARFKAAVFELLAKFEEDEEGS
ncbi:transcription factor Adf-1-like [Centruroides vittatus]|uniref:transcription factor Adf-1-like n=1 Tax=Centruroides vittatus TaxID=120091 RepID=UPI0035109EEA